MKILVLTSRYTATRDIIKENFGRQVRLFSSLRKLGNDITFFCLDYQKYETKKISLNKIKVYIKPFSFLRIPSVFLRLSKLVKRGKYDAVFITSDPLWAVFGIYLRKRFNIPIIYDIQDNYALYKSYLKLPFVAYFHKSLIKRSSLVLGASDILTKEAKGMGAKNAVTIANGVDLSLFRPLNKKKCRDDLRLPQDTKIISYIGTIQKRQGIDILLECFNSLKKDFPRLKLFIAGNILSGQETFFDFSDKDIIYRGSMPQKDIVKAINASDCLVIPYPLNRFTKVMQAPYKIVEFMACNRPLVITDVGSMPKLLDNKRFTAKPSDIKDLAAKIKLALKTAKISNRDKIKDYSWNQIAKKLNKFLKRTQPKLF